VISFIDAGAQRREVVLSEGIVQGRAASVRQALRLEYLTVGWNVVEGIVAISAAVLAGSVALLGFGIDSFVESDRNRPHDGVDRRDAVARAREAPGGTPPGKSRTRGGRIPDDRVLLALGHHARWYRPERRVRLVVGGYRGSARDDLVHRRSAVLAYLAMPFDVVPDFVPVLGYADERS
jgi:hypothetical protein